MLTEQELNAALDLTRKIERLQGRLDDLRETGGVGSPGASAPVQGGCGTVSAGQIAAELEIEIADLRKRREIEQIVIQRYIDKSDLEDVERKLMLLRYVDCRPWTPLATSLGYSRSHVLLLHRNAIKKIIPHNTL